MRALGSMFGVPTGVPHSEVELQTESFTTALLGSNTNQHMNWTLGGTCISLSPSLSTIRAIALFKYRGGNNAHWISKNKMATKAVQCMRYKFPWKYHKFYEFRVICKYGKVCLGVVCPAPKGAGRMMPSKPIPCSGFDFIIHPAPSGAGRTTPEQPGHYPLIQNH